MGRSGADAVLYYHDRTKHHPQRWAPSPGFLDWANQPDPFRRFAGAPAVELPLAADRLDTCYDDLYRPGAVAARPLTLDTLAAFFELALGLSAWKQFRGHRWALRCNPSSGNLHPTEGYALLPALGDLPAGLYHYLSLDHVLERRSALDAVAALRLGEWLPPGGFLAGFSSILWREAWKYGARAFRYCALDAGHALASARYAAACLGWSARLVTGLADTDLAGLLGLDREADHAGVDAADREHPEALLLLAPGREGVAAAAQRIEAAADELVELIRGGSWTGSANALSPVHVGWPAIDAVAEATRKPTTGEAATSLADAGLPDARPSSRARAAQLIRARRSAVEMDGVTTLTDDVLYTMLDHLLPRASVAPLDVLPWAPCLHLGVFVHRIRGLEPGLYAFVRSDAARDELRSALSPDFLWEPPGGCPRHLGLFLLRAGDLRSASSLAACGQSLAANGALSLGMFAKLPECLSSAPWWYRRLHWEAGAVGQALYLEAEAAGVRATGMGCFFDDEFLAFLGLADSRYQDIYHFTVGGPVDDPRLATLPPYAHLAGRASGG